MNDMKPITYRDYVEPICIGSGAPQFFFCIKLFEDTPLRDTRLIRIEDLENLIKHHKNPLRTKPLLFHWEKKGDEKLFKLDCNGPNLRLVELIEHCEGIRLWFKEYHPEYII